MFFFLIVSYFISMIAGGDSLPFLLVDNENVIREYIDDNGRKEKIYLVLDEAKEERRAIIKESEQINKELEKLLRHRDSKREQFIALANRSRVLRLKMQEVNLTAVIESQKHISEKEWALMKVDFYKKNTSVVKSSVRIENRFDKMVERTDKKINRVIENKTQAAEITAGLQNLQTNLSVAYHKYQNEMLNEESILYQYDLSIAQIEKIQEWHFETIQMVFRDIVDLHFLAVNNTNEREWRKLRGRLQIPI